MGQGVAACENHDAFISVFISNFVLTSIYCVLLTVNFGLFIFAPLHDGGRFRPPDRAAAHTAQPAMQQTSTIHMRLTGAARPREAGFAHAKIQKETRQVLRPRP